MGGHRFAGVITPLIRHGTRKSSRGVSVVSSHFVNYHFVNSHLVNVDKVGIDEVGIAKVIFLKKCDAVYMN